MSEPLDWYVLDTAGSKPYRAVGPHQNYSQADRFGFWEFGTYSLVKISRRLAMSKYDTSTVEQFMNAS
jgi:hypothetical protein